MGTEVLRPQDLLAERVRVPFASRNHPENRNLTNLTVNRKGNRTGQRKFSPKSNQKKMITVTEAKKQISAEPRRKHDATNGGLVMGQVTLLRRGESLNPLTSKIKGGDVESTSPNPKPVEDPVIREPDLISPVSPVEDLVIREPDLMEPVSPLPVMKQINVLAPIDGYAGSPFYSSPSPRSVPVPSFFKKQQVYGKIKSSDDSVTRDLRRLLRLG